MLLTQLYNKRSDVSQNDNRTTSGIFVTLHDISQYLVNENKSCTLRPHTAAWDSGGAVK